MYLQMPCKMSSKPLVSVVMPVYNGERYLRQAIDSILAQTFNDFEFIVVDNGSTDHSLAIVRSYEDSRIRIFEESQRGIVAALNKGLHEARGQYVARMDADDISIPERLAKQVDYMHLHPDVVLAGANALVIDAKGDPTEHRLLLPSASEQLALLLCMSNYFVHGSTMIRHDALEAVGGYRKEFVTAEDYDLWLRLREVGRVANVPELLYMLRVHDRSKTAEEGKRFEQMYIDRAQQAALQRCIDGWDELGYTTPDLAVLELRNRSSHGHAPIRITLADWAFACMQQHQFSKGNHLLLHAVLAQPITSHTWSTIRQCYFSTATARVILQSCSRFYSTIAVRALDMLRAVARL